MKIVRKWQRRAGVPYVATHRESGRGVVYFVQGISTRMIKIGFSVSVKGCKKRIDSIKGLSPDKIILLKIMDGGSGVEHGLHRRFAAYKSHNEWFYPCPELVEYIKAATWSSKALDLSRDATSEPYPLLSVV